MFITVKRLEWAGHIICASENRTIKNILNTKPEGNRKVGRMCVAGHKNFGCKELEEGSIEWGRMASNSEEGQGSQRAVVPVMIFSTNLKPFKAFTFLNVTRFPISG
jgi:hypothetical protein